MKKSLLAAALISVMPAALSAGEPAAAGNQDDGQEILKQWDTNGDGVIARAEARAASAKHIAQVFAWHDANKDGQLTAEELRDTTAMRADGKKSPYDGKFKSADTNADGRISRDEAAQSMPMLAKRFDDVDTDNNGLVSPDELRAHHKSMHQDEHDDDDGDDTANAPAEDDAR
jgi:Ca2+-binding EF-hand superfamily protein